MRIKTAVIIVMYNQWCGDAYTCATINRNSVQPDVILVVDNSTRDMKNDKFCEERGWLYHSMQGNAGLSKAYNAALDILQNRAELIVWADDDTFFPENYFEKLEEYALHYTGSELFLPVVKSKRFYLSPAIYTQRCIVPITSLDDIEGKEVTAINSGLAVKYAVYHNYRYDENIFLDYLDHDFLRWCRMNGKKITVMKDVCLQQSFFAASNPSPQARKHRTKIYLKDIRVFEAKCGKNRLLTEWDLLKYLLCQKRDFIKNGMS